MDKEKGSNQTDKPYKENAKNIINNRINPTCNLHGTGRYIDLCKVVHSQAKNIRTTLLSTHGGGFRDNTMDSKKRSDDGKEMKTVVVSFLAKALKLIKNPKDKDKYDSHLEDKSENFNFKIWILEWSLTQTDIMASRSSYTNTSYVRKSIWLKNSFII